MLSVILSKQAIYNYLRTFGITILLVIIGSCYIMYNVVEGITTTHKKTVNEIIEHEGIDITTICNSVGCRRIEYNGRIYEIGSNYILKVSTNPRPKFNFKYQIQKDIEVTSNWCEILTFNKSGYKLEVCVPLEVYLNGTTKMIVSSTLLLLFLSVLLHIRYSLKEHSMKQIENRSNMLESETKLQRTLVEFANHEIVLPLAIIKTKTDDIYRCIYPCNISKNGICTFNKNSFEQCKTCPMLQMNRKGDNEAYEHYVKIHLAIERIEAVLGQMSDNKAIKRGNGNISIAKLIRTAVNGVNIDVNKIGYEIVKEKDLEDLAVRAPANNGLILNMLSNHITNSKEALASMVKFTYVINKHSRKLNLYITDNGRGIRDINDKIIDPKKIFEKGFTTKDANGKNVFIQETFWQSIKSKLFGEYRQKTSIRGVGLYLNKEIMNNHGGDIQLVKTSPEGTTFLLIFPIKKRER